jgi:ubiquitin carboxyl-terminal hydrolase 14
LFNDHGELRKLSMTILNVIIKWNGQKFPVAVDVEQPGLVFKTQIFSLTNVAPERQKIMVKGGTVKVTLC